MPKTKISEFSATAGNNTDIDGINIAEGCAPSGINDAIRELMAQLKDFQAGTAGDSFNGPIGSTTPAAGAFTNLSASGTFALTGDQVQISEGGTGQTTANAAFNALAPSQTSNSGKYLKTDGTNTSWDAIDINTADITGTLPIANGGTGLTALGTGVQTALGQNVTGSGGIVLATSPTLVTPALGTPSSVTLTNATGLPISTGVSGLGTGVATALAVNTGSAGAFVVNGGALGTPSSGTVTNLTGTASININGTVGATTPNTGSFTTLTTSSTVTINGGTANGVAYLNGSKVLTTGSEFSYNGSVFQVGTGAATRIVDAVGASNSVSYRLRNWDAIGCDSGSGLTIGGLTGSQWTSTQFFASGSEQMRLTSTGLGIGTSSPVYKLTVDVTGASATSLFKTNQATSDLYLQASGTTFSYSVGIGASANALRFMSGSLGTTMLLDSSGNLGLGVTPSAWRSTTRALQVGTGTSLQNFDNTGVVATSLGSNLYFNSSDQAIYLQSYAASSYALVGGEHRWNIAPSGTAGTIATFTQAMTLDASGNLGIGTTSPFYRLSVRQPTLTATLAEFRTIDGTNNPGLEIRTSTAGTTLAQVYSSGATANLLFETNSAERARIDSNGNLFLKNSADNVVIGNAASGGMYLGGGNTNTNVMVFQVGSERARITSDGNLGVGESNPSTARLFVTSDGSVLDNVYVKNTNTSAGTNNSVVFVRGSNTVGTITTTLSATAYNTSSDYRLKNITGPVTGSGEFIDALKPKVGTWKADGSKFVGFLAHEVQEVSPGSVTGTKDAVDEEGNPIMQGMEYGSAEFIANIIAELQSLRARVAQLEAK